MLGSDADDAVVDGSEGETLSWAVWDVWRPPVMI